MHYQLEIIMPPTDDVSAAVKEILTPFDENAEDSEDRSMRYVFWDYWLIGGRWSGNKLLSLLGDERLDAFRQLLADRHITAAGLQWGKPTLSPADQRPIVDAMWRDAFPDAPIFECPLFDYYKGNSGDVMMLKEAPRAITCQRVIVAAPDYKGERLESVYMIQESIWNGVTHVETTWDDWLVVTIDYHS